MSLAYGFGLVVDAWLVGGLILILNLPAILAPAKFRRAVEAFPRSRWPAWILTALDLVWVAWVVYHASLGWFDLLKPAIPLAVPIAFLLLAVFMDELLAPRALGGLLMLLANPILNDARWLDTPWRLVMVLIAYVWVVAGMILVLSPHRFRTFMAFMTRGDSRCRMLGAARALLGLFVILLGLTVY